MKFTLSWLKQPLDTTATLEQICSKLTAIGLEVESVEDRAKIYAPFKVAYVESAVQHPNADRLKVCMVKTDQGTLQVVCGAPNARAGMKGVFAPEGSVIPNSGMVLKKGKIRDVESNGMLVSEEEMALPETIDGIIEVDDKWEIGTPLAEVFGLNDPVIEINLTPNRIDCAGVYGIARDLAAAGIGTLRPVNVKPLKGSFKSPIGVKIEDNDGCPLFLGRYIKGVKNGASPEWLKTLLAGAGQKSISTLVDITNFMSLDHCRPLHVFDADKLKGNIVVRASKAGETLAALNEETYTLPDGAVAICNDSGVIGLGGIMGGASTGVDENTVNVYVEAAYFNPARIARTGRDLQIASDARYRFERGVDPEFTTTGMELATQMILDLCGGEVSEIVTAGAMPQWQRSIDYDPALMKTLIGMDVPASKQKDILSALGFKIDGDKTFKVHPPSWRGDIDGAADITEEIARIIGFDALPAVSVRSPASVGGVAETQTLRRVRLARNALAVRGLDECITWSFTGHEQARRFGANDIAALTLKNPISSELDVMRPSILPNLIQASQANHDRGYPNAALYEIGPIFRSVTPEGQAMVAAGVRMGSHQDRHWSNASAARAVDLYDAKADAMAALEACEAPSSSAQITREVPGHYHPGRAGALKLGPNVLAYFGEIHPAVLVDMGIKFPVVGFEVFLQNLPEARKKGGTEKPLLKLEPLQPIHRDFAFLVDGRVSGEDILRAAKAADKALIVDAEIFDIYQGKGVEDGKKSLAFSITIQPQGQSLTDKDLETLMEKVIVSVSGKTGGVLRK